MTKLDPVLLLKQICLKCTVKIDFVYLKLIFKRYSYNSLNETHQFFFRLKTFVYLWLEIHIIPYIQLEILRSTLAVICWRLSDLFFLITNLKFHYIRRPWFKKKTKKIDEIFIFLNKNLQKIHSTVGPVLCDLLSEHWNMVT